MIDFLLASMMIVGCLFILAAGIGIVRFKDTICRAHALSKAVTLGLSLVLLALLLSNGTWIGGVKIVLAILFNFVSIPIAGHILARYAIK